MWEGPGERGFSGDAAPWLGCSSRQVWSFAGAHWLVPFLWMAHGLLLSQEGVLIPSPPGPWPQERIMLAQAVAVTWMLG